MRSEVKGMFMSLLTLFRYFGEFFLKYIIQIVLQVNQRPFRGFIHQIMKRISAGHLHELCREVKRLALLQKHSTQQHLN